MDFHSHTYIIIIIIIIITIGLFDCCKELTKLRPVSVHINGRI